MEIQVRDIQKEKQPIICITQRECFYLSEKSASSGSPEGETLFSYGAGIFKLVDNGNSVASFLQRSFVLPHKLICVDNSKKVEESSSLKVYALKNKVDPSSRAELTTGQENN
ncbi:hypothetical protein HY798_00750 [Candidatus Falkowbacteria bacterium]|nr:hypothetical protein [Candidatus Falkowbacteria bacterium]